MKILHISTYDTGGAAKACIRLHKGLMQQGISSKLLLLFGKNPHEPEENINIFNEDIPFYKKKKSLIYRGLKKLRVLENDALKRQAIKELTPNPVEIFSFPDTLYDITLHPAYREADIIHLHWVSGFLDYSFFSKNKKTIVWTLHDMNPFTGGCHYSGDCEGYKNDCTYCPILEPLNIQTYTRKLLQYKTSHLRHTSNIHIVSPSKWLANCSFSSSSLKKYNPIVIPYGINGSVYKPYNKVESRKMLNLPEHKKIFLFVADSIENRRKGGRFFFEAIQSLPDNYNINAYTIGKKTIGETRSHITDLGAIFNEDILARIYSAADAVILPSVEDNLPNTALESLLCGTPIIGFSTGGISEIIQEGENGYLTSIIKAEKLSELISHFIQHGVSLSRDEIHENAIKQFDISVSTESYLTLYKNILNKLC